MQRTSQETNRARVSLADQFNLTMPPILLGYQRLDADGQVLGLGHFRPRESVRQNRRMSGGTRDSATVGRFWLRTDGAVFNSVLVERKGRRLIKSIVNAGNCP